MESHRRSASRAMRTRGPTHKRASAPKTAAGAASTSASATTPAPYRGSQSMRTRGPTQERATAPKTAAGAASASAPATTPAPDRGSARLLCIASIITETSDAGGTQSKQPLRLLRQRGVVGGAGGAWAGVNTVSKAFPLPRSVPCAWNDLPQAKAIRTIPAGNSVLLLGRDVTLSQAQPYVEESIRSGAAVRLCFVARGLGDDAEGQRRLQHATPLFTVADILDAPRVNLGLDKCATCGSGGDASNTLLRCGQCKCRFYCSQKCQLDDWPKHKLSCVNSLRAIKASAAMDHTFCPLAQHHTEDAFPIKVAVPAPTHMAAVSNGVASFQEQIRGVKRQIRELVARRLVRPKQSTAASSEGTGGIGSTGSGETSDISFIPLLDPVTLGDFVVADSEETAKSGAPTTTTTTTTTTRHSSLCCGDGAHDMSKLVPIFVTIPPSVVPESDSLPSIVEVYRAAQHRFRRARSSLAMDDAAKRCDGGARNDNANNVDEGNPHPLDRVDDDDLPEVSLHASDPDLFPDDDDYDHDDDNGRASELPRPQKEAPHVMKLADRLGRTRHTTGPRTLSRSGRVLATPGRSVVVAPYVPDARGYSVRSDDR